MPKFIPFSIEIPYRWHEKQVKNLCKSDEKYAEIETVCSLIRFTIKMNVCYQLFEHLARAYFPPFSSSNAIAEEKLAKLSPYQMNEKCLKLNFLCCLPDMHEQKLLIANNLFYLENRKAYLMFCFIMTGENEKSLEKTLKFKVFFGKSEFIFIDIKSNHDNCLIYWQILWSYHSTYSQQQQRHNKLNDLC